MANAAGIDVSNLNGEFDWSPWGHIDFAFAKATEGTGFLDGQFARNWRLMWDLYQGRLVRLAYCFFHPAENVAQQAETLVTFVSDHGLRPGDHFTLDHETTDGLPPAEVSRAGAAFSARVNKLAPEHRCICYTFPAFAEEGYCDGLGPWRLFAADIGVSEPVVPSPWTRARFWQYQWGHATAHGAALAAHRAAGRPEPDTAGLTPDLDVYLGTREDLLAFARMPQDRR